MDAAQTCSPASTYNRDMESALIEVDFCRTGEFVLMGEREYRVYLPAPSTAPTADSASWLTRCITTSGAWFGTGLRKSKLNNPVPKMPPTNSVICNQGWLGSQPCNEIASNTGDSCCSKFLLKVSICRPGEFSLHGKRIPPIYLPLANNPHNLSYCGLRLTSHTK